MKTESTLRSMWEEEGTGLTFEDYCIFVTRIGHIKYRTYRAAHWRDVDVTTGMDVWNALHDTTKPFQKAVTF